MKKRSKKQVREQEQEYKLKNHITLDKKTEIVESFLSILKKHRCNWHDIFIIGHDLIDKAYLNSLQEISKNITRHDLSMIKKEIEESRVENLDSMFFNLLVLDKLAFIYGNPFYDIEIDDKNSKRISLKLKERFKILARDNFRCIYCGRGSPEVFLQLEHVIPRSKGGKDNFSNLATCCLECNLGKRDSLLSDINKNLSKSV